MPNYSNNANDNHKVPVVVTQGDKNWKNSNKQENLI